MASIVVAMLFATANVKEAHALGPTTSLYLDNATSRTTTIYYPTVTPLIITRRTTVGNVIIYLRIANAPHETTEPENLLTDKTYGFQVNIHFDPAYFSIANPATDISEFYSATQGNFLKRHFYQWNDPDETPESADEFWSEYTPPATYPTLGVSAVVDNVAGTISFMANGLKGFFPDANPLPAMYFDPYAGPYAPDHGRYNGLKYDLPYTENLTQITAQPDGSSVTDPNYNTLVRITFYQHTLTPTGTGYAGVFHMYETLLFCRDGQHTYNHQDWDIYYQNIPAAPEFPLGIAPIMMAAPLIPIVYLWRIRRRKIR